MGHKTKRRKTDPVWDFIDEIGGKRYCRFCRKEYSKDTGITTIKAHFKRNHPNKWNEVFVQTVLQFPVVEPYSKKDSEKVAHLMEHLVRWIITDQQAFSVVENNDFRAFVAALDQRFKLPTRQSISQNILKRYTQEQDLVRTFLSKTKQKFAITTDAWSACTNLGYLAITLHWINDDWNMSQILLDMVPLHERHTGKYIAEKVLETITYYDIGARILSATTDNASNMDVFARTFGETLRTVYGNFDFEHVRCAAHVLNLAVNDGMRIISNSITKLRNFASFIRRSQPVFEELKKIFAMKDRPFLVPDLDVPTRWNSTYVMIDKLRRIHDMTDILVAGDRALKERYPTDDDWTEIDAVAKLLEPMAEATNLLSASSHPTMGDLHIAFPVILKILDNALEEDGIQSEIARRMHAKLDGYWAELQLRCHPSVVLDPNVKLSSFNDETASSIRELIRNTYARYVNEEPSVSTSANENSSGSSRRYFKNHLKHASLAGGNHARDILEDYLSSAEEDCNALEFWKVRSTDARYSGLVQMARDHLVVQATSVPSERVFSLAKHTISPTRNRLSEENVRASICLKTWYEAGVIDGTEDK